MSGSHDSGTHRYEIHLAETLDAYDEPDYDQSAYDDCPDPVTAWQCSVCGKGSVIYHDRSPPDKLKYIQHCEKERSLAAKAQRNSLHGAHSPFAAHTSRKKQQEAAYDMTYDYRQQSLREAERSQKGPCHYFGQTNTRAEPYQRILKYRSPFHGHNYTSLMSSSGRA